MMCGPAFVLVVVIDPMGGGEVDGAYIAKQVGVFIGIEFGNGVYVFRVWKRWQARPAVGIYNYITEGNSAKVSRSRVIVVTHKCKSGLADILVKISDQVDGPAIG